MPPAKRFFRTIQKTVLVLLVAVFFRCYRLEEMLPGFSEDEAYGAVRAARFATGLDALDPLHLYAEGISQSVIGGFQPGYYYAWPAGLFSIFGFSVLVWRASSFLLSIGTVLLLYPFSRRVVGERSAFWAALLLAGSRWHASDGRWGWLVVAASFLQAAGALLLCRGIVKKTAAPAVAGGFLLAFAVPLYPSTIPTALVPLALAVSMRIHPRRAWLGFFAGFAVGLLPVATILLRQPAEFLARGRSASVFAEAAGGPVLLFLAANLVHYMGLFLIRGDPLGWHTLPGTPALDVASGILFLLGLLLALRKLRSRRSTIELLFLGAAIAPGLLAQTTDAPNQYRVDLAAVWVALLAGRGLVALTAFVARRRGHLAGAWAPPILIALSLAANVHFLFARWPKHPSLFYGYHRSAVLLARDVDEREKTGRRIAIDHTLVDDPIYFNLARSRNAAEAAAAREAPRPPVVLGAGSQSDVRFFRDDRPAPVVRRDPWGRPLYGISE